MLEKIFLIVLIAFAFLAVQTIKLRRAIIYLGVFSLVMSFAYLFYNAPDVAIAEVAIGCSLSTILYLVALKKTNTFSICFIEEHEEPFNDKHILAGQSKILRSLERYLISRELDPQIVYTQERIEMLVKSHEYDLIIRNGTKKVYIYGDTNHEVIVDISAYFDRHKHMKSKVEIRSILEVNDYDL